MSLVASPFQSSAYLRVTLLLIAIDFETIKGSDLQKKKMHFEVSSTRFFVNRISVALPSLTLKVPRHSCIKEML